MEEGSQEKVVEYYETKIDISHLTSEKNSDLSYNDHRNSINDIIVSQYTEDYDYVVTYSHQDSSFLGWTINNEGNGQQQPDVYVKIEDTESYSRRSSCFVLHEKIVAYYDHRRKYF